MAPPTLTRPSRRELAARVASRIGVLRGVRAVRAQRGLLVLAYHRIGDPAECLVDEGLVSATPGTLRDHLRILHRWMRCVTLDEVDAAYSSGRPFREPLALVTFDDAYRDNVSVALPILKEAGTPAVFFVATGFIGRRHVPWWDRLAYAVRHARRDSWQAEYPTGFEVRDIRAAPEEAMLRLQRRIKGDSTLDVGRFVAGVEIGLGARAAEDPRVGEQFASWGELREVAAAGMDLQSHTHSHALLGHLSYDEQVEELARSRQELREHAGVDPVAVAYPVGQRRHFSADTRRAMEATGYRLGFSHYGGWNASAADRCDIRRVRVDRDLSPAMVRAAAALPRFFAV